MKPHTAPILCTHKLTETDVAIALTTSNQGDNHLAVDLEGLAVIDELLQLGHAGRPLDCAAQLRNAHGSLRQCSLQTRLKLCRRIAALACCQPCTVFQPLGDCD